MVPQKVSKQPSYMFPICIAYFTIFLYLSKSVISIEHCADTCVFFFIFIYRYMMFLWIKIRHPHA